MFVILTALAALISLMFMASFITALTELKREHEEVRAVLERNKPF
ncbi:MULTISPECIES: hypothetical protein [Rhizobium/Agrobacterium group]|jgi:hypothetical protein|nr:MULTISPECIES: hypothetical protein [Rhizobium/Agrobacterium group]MCS4242412.1 hypothetical protein [Rhizobium sp. BIGb0125]MDO5895852.1 hypothetical protein [Agrobacterium sp. Azo12]